MENLMWPVIGLTVFSVTTMIGIFSTKTPGFGKYSTSVVILTVIVFIASFFLLFKLISSQVFANIIFAVAGYAGGLINGKDK
jgi:hypothetical protein